MDLALPERPQILLVIGVICIVASVGLLYLGFPAYNTSIVERAPSEKAMVTSLESYTESEIDTVAFSTLSSAEQTAITRASQSPQWTYTDRGSSDRGSHFEYRNDVVNHYFVSYNGSIHLVHVVIDMNPLLLGGGSLGGVAGIALVIGGLWSIRTGR